MKVSYKDRYYKGYYKERRNKMKNETKEKVKRIAEGLLIGCTSAVSVIGIALIVNGVKTKNVKNTAKFIQFRGTPEDRMVHMRVIDQSTGRKVIGLKTNVENAKTTFEHFKEAIEKAEA